jgi:hypothetical protein
MYRKLFVAIALFSILSCNNSSVIVEAKNNPKKLIDFGWNNPRSDFVRQHILEMEKRPFSGFTMQLGVSNDIFTKTAYPETDYMLDRENLKNTTFSKLTENFIRMDSKQADGWSWLNDTDWKAALENVRQMTRTAKVGHFKGIMFDAEPYGNNPWDYTAAKYNGKSFDEVSKVVRQRGHEFITVVHREMPGAKILSLWMLKLLQYQRSVQGATRENIAQALLLPFIEGWLDGEQTEEFIDGNEGGYYNASEREFVNDRIAMKATVSLLSSANAAKFAQKVRVGQSIFVEGLLDTYKSPRFIGYFFASDQERLKIFEHNIYQALKTSDEYVWVYSEQVNWWTGKIPSGLEDAQKRAFEHANNAQPLGFDPKPFAELAKKNFEERNFIWGQVSGVDGSVYTSGSVESGIKDGFGKESACFIYNPQGMFYCQVPHGWKGTLTPTLSGKTFDPPTRAYQTSDIGPGAWLENQNFAAK